MTAKDQVIEILENVLNAKRVYRDEARNEILKRPELIPALLEVTFGQHKSLSIKAAWILELICLYEIRSILPYVDYFTSRLKAVRDESALRPVAKIGSLITTFFFKEPWEVFNPKSIWVNELVEQNFEWLTEDHKVAAKVYAMESLYYWGNQMNWIHEELYFILEKDYRFSSAGYQSRARKILDKIYRSKALNS